MQRYLLTGFLDCLPLPAALHGAGVRGVPATRAATTLAQGRGRVLRRAGRRVLPGGPDDAG